MNEELKEFKLEYIMDAIYYHLEQLDSYEQVRSVLLSILDDYNEMKNDDNRG